MKIFLLMGLTIICNLTILAQSGAYSRQGSIGESQSINSDRSLGVGDRIIFPMQKGKLGVYFGIDLNENPGLLSNSEVLKTRQLFSYPQYVGRVGIILKKSKDLLRTIYDIKMEDNNEPLQISLLFEKDLIHAPTIDNARTLFKGKTV